MPKLSSRPSVFGKPPDETRRRCAPDTRHLMRPTSISCCITRWKRCAGEGRRRRCTVMIRNREIQRGHRSLQRHRVRAKSQSSRWASAGPPASCPVRPTGLTITWPNDQNAKPMQKGNTEHAPDITGFVRYGYLQRVMSPLNCPVGDARARAAQLEALPDRIG